MSRNHPLVTIAFYGAYHVLISASSLALSNRFWLSRYVRQFRYIVGIYPDIFLRFHHSWNVYDSIDDSRDVYWCAPDALDDHR